MASHPIRDTAHPIESRPNKNNGDVGEGSPFGDLHVLESQLREELHVSSRYSHLTTGDDNVSSPSQNTKSISQLGMASSVPSNCDNAGISAVALEAQLREYRKLHRHRSHIQQQQQFRPSRGIESIEEEQTVVAQNVTPVIGARARARRTDDSRNSSGVGDRFVDKYIATLNQTEQNTSSVICSSCKNRLYAVPIPMAELFTCQICRNITPMRPCSLICGRSNRIKRFELVTCSFWVILNSLE